MEVTASTDSTRSNYSDDSEVDDIESMEIEGDRKNFDLCAMATSSNNVETTTHSFQDNTRLILSYPHHDQPQHYITSDRSDHSASKSIVVSKADTISHSHENQCQAYKTDTNSVSLNHFLMYLQLQMGKLNENALLELNMEIHKLIVEKLKKPENLKND